MDLEAIVIAQVKEYEGTLKWGKDLNNITVGQSVRFGDCLDVENVLKKLIESDLEFSVLRDRMGMPLSKDRGRKSMETGIQGKVEFSFGPDEFLMLMGWLGENVQCNWKVCLDPRGNQRQRSRFRCHLCNRQLRQCKVMKPPREKVQTGIEKKQKCIKGAT